MKILVIDDHHLVRAGLRPVLEQLGPESGENIEVHEAGSFPAALEIAAGHPDLDLAILDFNLPGVNGFAALVDLRERFPEVPVVMMSGEDDPWLMREAIERGAIGFIPKSSPAAVFLNAIRLVISGGAYLPREIMNSKSAAPPAASAPRMSPETLSRIGITARQADVLALLLAGKPNKLICRELELSEGTVKTHVAAIFKALNVNSRVEAVIAASRLGIKS
jgi:DNA-binding NarL/FixJ family response regulator